MARREELWTVKVGKRIAKLKRTREQIAGLAALAEHARAVRIVKREIDRIKKGQYTFTAGAKDSVLNELQRVLELLQKGRA